MTDLIYLPHLNKAASYIVVSNPQGFAYIEELAQYKNNPDPNIINLDKGEKLLDLLKETQAIIIDSDDELTIKKSLTDYISKISYKENINSKVGKLLGKIGEALIIRSCAEDKNQNRKWAQIARRGKKLVQTPDDFEAIGTGLLSTHQRFKKRFYTNDPQRDIVWINKQQPNLELLTLKGVSKKKVNQGGNIAGIQVKVGGNAEYIIQSIKRNNYQVPVVYFDLNNDFKKVQLNLLRKKLRLKKLDQNFSREQIDDLINNFELNIIRGRDIDENLHEELKEYSILLKEILSGKMRVDELGKIRELSTVSTLEYVERKLQRSSQVLTIPKHM